MKSVYSAVRTGSLNKAVCASSVKGYFDATQEAFLAYSTFIHLHQGQAHEKLPEYPPGNYNNEQNKITGHEA